ncbi:MAG TPA: nitrous oxide reductase family maturation protein NosD [Panacibacter sp.]|nr:nitrous oxide reductase family maturation protein NosD [Panacibacter sp.]HNP42654.1 nitrous oxide reductase family maturation protein NosD [Panacibacter sp.]
MKNISFILFFFLVFATRFTASAMTNEVGANSRYKTIRAAIEAAQPGDTILVYKGIYAEKELIINKSIVIKGIDNPVLDGENKYEIITVRADHVTVEGLSFRNAGFSSLTEIAAVKLDNCKYAFIHANDMEVSCFGVYVQASAGCIIKDNVLHSTGKGELTSGDGIHCWKSDSLQIIHNSISSFRDGIYLEFVKNSVIWRNTSEHNIRYGLHFMTAHDNAYICNVFRANGAGVAVMYTHGVKMYNNLFTENTGDAAFGLLLKEISDSEISGNQFVNNTSGAYMEASTRVLVEHNVFKGNGWALKVQANCDAVNVVHNNFSGNSFDISTSGTLVMNTFNSNYWDKYQGYDLNKDKIGDVPYRPVSMYSMLVEKNPTVMMLFRSFIVTLMDKTEKVLPGIIPENLVDNSPLMKPLPL